MVIYLKSFGAVITKYLAQAAPQLLNELDEPCEVLPPCKLLHSLDSIMGPRSAKGLNAPRVLFQIMAKFNSDLVRDPKAGFGCIGELLHEYCKLGAAFPDAIFKSMVRSAVMENSSPIWNTRIAQYPVSFQALRDFIVSYHLGDLTTGPGRS